MNEEIASLQGELVRALGGAVATSSLLGVPLGHNSSFLQGPAFAPPRIREAIWCGSTNSTTEEGIIMNFLRIVEVLKMFFCVGESKLCFVNTSANCNLFFV